MNELELMDALVLRLERLFYGHPFMNRKGDVQELNEVKIFAQYIPQAEGIMISGNVAHGVSGYTEDDFMKNFPCAVVRILDRTDNEERSIVMSQINVKIVACVYDESSANSGYRDVMNMLSMMRDDFRENRFIAQKFRVLMPLKSRMPDTDTWPVTYGEVDLSIETGRKLAPEEYIYRREFAFDGRGIYDGFIGERIRTG